MQGECYNSNGHETEQRQNASEDNFALPLKTRIVEHLARSDVILKSQQRSEPDLSLKERLRVCEELIDQSPVQFLYRFGKHLKREHLQYFGELPSNSEIDFYLQEIQKSWNHNTKKTKIKNRRYGAFRELQSSNYFSEVEMQKRDPLLYDELIEKNLTEEEKVQRNQIDITSRSFSSLLLEQMDWKDLQTKKDLQKELESNAQEEFDDDSDGEEEEEEMGMDEEVCKEEKALMKQEFYSSSYAKFLSGNDKGFDYSTVDESEKYDVLDVLDRDEEERYFDED